MIDTARDEASGYAPMPHNRVGSGHSCSAAVDPAGLTGMVHHSMYPWNEKMMTTQDIACEHEPHLLRAAKPPPLARELESAAEMFRALADPLRLRLLCRLATGEACVSELAALEGDKLTTISARLKMLHGARLVRRRREAKHVIYALADEHVLHLVQNAIDHTMERNLPTAPAPVIDHGHQRGDTR